MINDVPPSTDNAAMSCNEQRFRAAQACLPRLGRGLAFLALALLAIGAATLALLRYSVPSSSGVATLAGLSEPVEVVYDREAVPHIRAGASDDAYTALGFVHAQHRLWQMELMRRAGQGRLSELFGDATLSADMFTRTLDLYGHAERSVSALSPQGRGANVLLVLADVDAEQPELFLHLQNGRQRPAFDRA